MPFALTNNMVNNLVNTIYKANGKDPYSNATRDSLSTTQGVENAFGTRDVSADTLKNTLNDSWSKVALTLQDGYHPDRARQLSQIVVDGLDSADGRSSGWVRLQNMDDYSDLLDAYTGEKRDGYISDSALQWGLQNGYLVVGEGGKLLSKTTARNDGDTIVTIHEDEYGPKLSLVGKASAPSYNPSPYDPFNAPYNSNPYSPNDPYIPAPAPYSPYDPYSNPGDYTTKRATHTTHTTHPTHTTHTTKHRSKK